MNYSVDKELSGWIRNCLGGYRQAVVLNSSMTRWRLVMSDVPQGPCFGTVALQYLYQQYSEIQCMLSKFADDRNLSGAFDTIEGRDSIQGDLENLRKWVHENLMRFNNCKVLHLDQDNPRHEYRLGEEVIKSSTVEKDLRVLVDGKLCSHSPESQPHPAKHQKQCEQQEKGGDSVPLCCSHEISPGILYPPLKSPAQERL